MPYGQVSRLAAVEKFHAPEVLFQGFTPCGCFKVEGGGEVTSVKIREHLTDDGAFGNVAFDNKVVLTDDVASSLRRLMSPLSQKQTDEILVCFWVPHKNPTHIHRPKKPIPP